MDEESTSWRNYLNLGGLGILTVVVLAGGFVLLQRLQEQKALMTIFAVIWGVGSVGFLYFVLNAIAQSLPKRVRSAAIAVVFAGPAIILLGWALVLPTLRTLWLSFFDATSSKFVWFKNFGFAFSDPIMLEAFKNNLLWIVFGTSACVILGIIIAVLADRSKFEKLIKALIFI